uniref:(northern house mosquito) hypothetical protein n=1 Tax=Culex pipiens TaxID=7175 RepID=A0A8D7ZVJ5_CULPI
MVPLRAGGDLSAGADSAAQGRCAATFHGVAVPGGAPLRGGTGPGERVLYRARHQRCHLRHRRFSLSDSLLTEELARQQQQQQQSASLDPTSNQQYMSRLDSFVMDEYNHYHTIHHNNSSSAAGSGSGSSSKKKHQKYQAAAGGYSGEGSGDAESGSSSQHRKLRSFSLSPKAGSRHSTAEPGGSGSKRSGSRKPVSCISWKKWSHCRQS